MPPEERQVCRFAAEPPQDSAPYGRWAQTLTEHFLAAFAEIDPGEDDLGEPGELRFFPDRSWHGRTFVPVTTRTSTGFDAYGYVEFAPGDEDEGPDDFEAFADYTDQTAEDNPEWKLDLCEEVLGDWRGEKGHVADMTLVWGVPVSVTGGVVATAELAGLTVDQCALDGDRFTLIAPDNYRGDFLDIRLWGADGRELAAESLYSSDDE
jgi:hypothetical protein